MGVARHSLIFYGENTSRNMKGRLFLLKQVRVKKLVPNKKKGT